MTYTHDDKLWLTTFGNTLRDARIAVGWSQEELAEASGLTRSYISDTERGRRNVSLVNLHRLSKALGRPFVIQ